MYAAFCPCLDIYSIAPLERYALVFFYLQGGGLYILGTATMTNTNVYSNEARYVRWPFVSILYSVTQPPFGVQYPLVS